MNSPPPSLTLAITTYNWPQALDLCLRSVARQSRLPEQVIVADDGSGAETARVIARWKADGRLALEHIWQEDSGFRLNRSRNSAILAARHPYLVLIDGDMLLQRHFIADHLRAARGGEFVQGTRARASAQRSATLFERQRIDARFWQSGFNGRQHLLRSPLLSRLASRAEPSLKRIKGCNQGYWLNDLFAVNGFNEAFTAWGPDDLEIAVRLFNLGRSRRYLRFGAQAVHLWHRESKPNLQSDGYTLLKRTQREELLRCELGLAERGIDCAYRSPPEPPTLARHEHSN